MGKAIKVTIIRPSKYRSKQSKYIDCLERVEISIREKKNVECFY